MIRLDVRILLVTGWLLLLRGTIFAQIAVYDYEERATWLGEGATSKQIVGGKRVFDLAEGKRSEIHVYPSSKKYIVVDRSSDSGFRIVGPKQKVYSLYGFGSYLEEGLSYLNYDSLFGQNRQVNLGGSSGSVSVPESMSGPSLSTFDEREPGAGGEIRQGTQSLRLDLKQSRNFNSRGYSFDEAVEILVSDYRAKGYKTFDEK